MYFLIDCKINENVLYKMLYMYCKSLKMIISGILIVILSHQEFCIDLVNGNHGLQYDIMT